MIKFMLTSQNDLKNKKKKLKKGMEICLDNMYS